MYSSRLSLLVFCSFIKLELRPLLILHFRGTLAFECKRNLLFAFPSLGENEV